MNIRSAILCSIAIVLSGCATQASLTVLSQPEGAYITEKETGRSYGVTPVTIVYDSTALSKFKGTDGCYRVKGFEARWVSGATANLNLIRLCGSSTDDYKITFSRPPTYPDLERDLQFALQLQFIRAQQQEARAAQDAAAAEVYRAFNPPQRKPLNCISTQSGNTVQTNCY
ncbi:MAG: hypothetical protein EPN79_13295 [Burkholderiaceae bacterium]|nr:MAG: hypothetical protein EPN79_13295 [Burkholderiaceae bacterium]TBR73218.1 MAG: hypothetical protein EPN64_17040 [Burkholderiaceae bacterium]